MKKVLMTLKVNGQEHEVAVKPNATLTHLLREELNLTGTNQGCGTGDCGACTVLLNGEAVNSCLVLALDADGADVLTIEGLEANGKMHPVQKSFVDHGAIQCGFCSPGMILSAYDYLRKNPKPTEAQAREAIAGNLCRCTGYAKIVEAIMEVHRYD